LTTAWQEALADTIRLVGQLLMIGGLLSITVTVKEQVDDRAPAVAVYVTVVTPTGKEVFGACVVVTVGTTTQLSVAVGGVQLATAEQDPPEEITMFDGQFANTGAELSTTVILKVQVVESVPAVAVYVTVVWPKGNVDPGACEDTREGVTTQLSDAVGGVQLTTAEHALFAATTISEGHPEITGAVLSTTVTLNVHVEERDPAVAV
jgi:hypothetical protein